MARDYAGHASNHRFAANTLYNWLASWMANYPIAVLTSGLRAARRDLFLEAGRTFDAIVLDPPKFAPTAAHAERAARAYKDINRLGFKLLRPGGVLFTFSCSGGVGVELFHKIVASAGLEAGVATDYDVLAAAPGKVNERTGHAAYEAVVLATRRSSLVSGAPSGPTIKAITCASTDRKFPKGSSKPCCAA